MRRCVRPSPAAMQRLGRRSSSVLRSLANGPTRQRFNRVMEANSVPLIEYGRYSRISSAAKADQGRGSTVRTGALVSLADDGDSTPEHVVVRSGGEKISADSHPSFAAADRRILDRKSVVRGRV